MNPIIFAFSILLASFFSVATEGGSFVTLMADVSHTIVAPVPEYVFIDPPPEILRGETYRFSVEVRGGRPGSPVVLFLQRPDGTLKYGDKDDVLSKIASRTTDRNGNWTSPRLPQTIDADAPLGTYVSWVVVGGVASNKVFHDVLPAKAVIKSFEALPGEVVSGSTATLLFPSSNVSSLRLRLTCPFGTNAHHSDNSVKLDLCEREHEMSGIQEKVLLQVSNSTETTKQVTARLTARDISGKVAGIKIIRIKVFPKNVKLVEKNMMVKGGTAPQLMVSLDTSTPSAELRVPASEGIPLTALKLRAIGESIELRSLPIQATVANSRAPFKIILWGNGEKLGEALFAKDMRAASLSLSKSVVILKDDDTILLLTAEPASLGAPVSIGDSLAADFDAEGVLSGAGALSGLPPVLAPDTKDTAAAAVRFYDSVPRVSSIPALKSAVGSDQILYRFRISADQRGPIGISKITFDIQTDRLRVSHLRLYGFIDDGFSKPAYHAKMLNFDAPRSSGSEHEIYFNPASQLSGVREILQIPASATRYFELRGDIEGEPSGSIQVSLAGDTMEASTAPFEIANAWANNNFLWTTEGFQTSVKNAEWANGYLVPGLHGLPLRSNRSPVVAEKVAPQQQSSKPPITSAAPQNPGSSAHDPLEFSIVEESGISGEPVKFSINADLSRVQRLELAFRCPEGVSMAGEASCADAIPVLPSTKVVKAIFTNQGRGVNVVVAVLRGYGSGNVLLATRLAILKLEPHPEPASSEPELAEAPVR